MRRRGGVALVVALVAVSLVACSSGRDRGRGAQAPEEASRTTTTITATSADPPPPEVTAADCALGAVPDVGEITFVRGGRLLGVAPVDGTTPRCLADGATAAPQWNGPGDRLVLDRAVILSKPTGTSVLRIDPRGRLLKRPREGGAEKDITFLDRTESAVYHPKGEHLAAVGTRGGTHGIYVATNNGEGAKLVTAGEFATRIEQLTWSASGALLFVADHDDLHHLQRLELPSLALTTVAEVAGTISSVAASRFEGAGLAWTETVGGGCALRVNRGGRSVVVPSSATASRPVGWLPGGVLVLREGCDGDESRVRTLDLTGEAPRVAVVVEGAQEVAVRAALPVGPGLDLDAVVESQAPA